MAEKALADVNTLQSKAYANETVDGYSPYTISQLTIIDKLMRGEEIVVEPQTNVMKEDAYIHVLDASALTGSTGLGGAAFTVLFEYEDQVVMIDTGWKLDSSYARINTYLRERGINRIDHLIVSHMHGDHAGGVPYFIENFDVGTIYMKPFDFQYSNTGEKDAEYYELALKAAQRKVNSTGEAVTIIEPNVEGYTVELGEDTFFSIYNCTEIFETTTQLDGNTFSMMVYFKSGTATAFVGADSTSLADEFVLGNIGQVDVYTLQHHGTNGPYSSAELMAELSPTYCVASTSPDELDKENGDGVYDTSDGQRVRCEAYGQVINPYNDGNRYFKIIDGKFVLQGDLESRWANEQTVQITETEIAYTASGRVTEDGNFVGNSNGTLVGAGKTTATALVLTVPESFPSTATVTLDDSVLYKVVGENARFRIVLNDKVVYPTQDGWLDFSDSSSENKVLIDLRLTVKAGDKLYFIVDGIDENGVQTQAYITMGLRIDGLWWDVVNVLHLNEADDNMPATKNFFNGTLYNGGVYARKDLISYMQVIVEDIEEE